MLFFLVSMSHNERNNSVLVIDYYKGVKMEDVLYTVSEVATLIKSNTTYVYKLIKSGLLPALKLGSCKVTRKSLLKFLEEYEGKDLSDVNNIVNLKF